MRAGRPRSQANRSLLERESQKPSRQAKADAVGGESRPTSSKKEIHEGARRTTKGHGGLRRATKGSGATCNGLPCSRTLICHPCPNFDSCFTWINRMDRMKNQAILSILPIHVSFNNCRHRLQWFSPAELRRRRRHFSPTRRRPNDSQANNPRAPARGSSGAANAAAALSRGRKPMETATIPGVRSQTSQSAPSAVRTLKAPQKSRWMSGR